MIISVTNFRIHLRVVPYLSSIMSGGITLQLLFNMISVLIERLYLHVHRVSEYIIKKLYVICSAKTLRSYLLADFIKRYLNKLILLLLLYYWITVHIYACDVESPVGRYFGINNMLSVLPIFACVICSNDISISKITLCCLILCILSNSVSVGYLPIVVSITQTFCY